MTPKNGRITNAELGRRIDGLTGEISDLRGLLVNVAVLDTNQKTMRDEIKELRSRVNKLFTINSISVMVAGTLGVLFGPKNT